jgi:hypothetical protein
VLALAIPEKGHMRPFRLLAATVVCAVWLPAVAVADPVVQTIGGTPMTIWVGDQGQLQARVAGDTANIFYNPQDQAGDAGLFLAFPETTTPPQNASLTGKVYGFDGRAGPNGLEGYAQRSQAATTGTGAPGDPFTQVTTYAVNPTDPLDPTKDLVTVKQTTSYINGNQTFDVRWDVTNHSGAPLRFKALAGADYYFEGDDHGTGIFTQGPPRFIGGTNADTGRSGGFIEAGAPFAPWSAYQALAYGNSDPTELWYRIEQAATATAATFDDSVLGENVDNAGGVEWDQALTAPLADGATSSYAFTVRTAAPAALQFDQTNAGAPQGVPITIVATAKDTAGTPFTGKPLRSTIVGVNPVSATAVIDAAGNAAITDPGTNAGFDTIVAYVDLNNNGTREGNEPQASAQATFVDNVPPKCAVKVTGDRPGGTGGAGKPLVISVDCDSPATVTSVSTLTITPPAATRTASTRAQAARKPKPKHKHKKKRKPKKVVVKLAPAVATVAPGQALPIRIAIPKAIAKKYAGALAKATVTVTAKDAAGNVSTARATRTVRLAKPKPKHKPKHKAKHKHKAKRR